MNEFLSCLIQQAESIVELCDRMERGDACVEQVRSFLPSLNQTITMIYDPQQAELQTLELNHEFVFQVLNDIIYGVENEDYVFLLDVLRYGLLEIYDYIAMELQSEE